MLEVLQSIYEEITGNYERKLTPDTEITNDLIGSSFGVIQLICGIEDHFDIEIPNKTLRSFKRIRDIMDYLETIPSTR